MSKWNNARSPVNYGRRNYNTYRLADNRSIAGPWAPICNSETDITLSADSRVIIGGSSYNFGGAKIPIDGNHVGVTVTMSNGIATSAVLGTEINPPIEWANGQERSPANVTTLRFGVLSFTDNIIGQDWTRCGEDRIIVRRCFGTVIAVETCEGFVLLQAASQLQGASF